MPKPLYLTVFLDESASLLQMDTTGTLDRTMAVYREFQKKGFQVSIVSYGGRDEYDFAERIPGMKILCNWHGLPKLTYIRRIHQIHAPRLLAADLLKARGPLGTMAARRASWAWQVPFIFRAGYFWSRTMHAVSPNDKKLIQHARNMETKAIREAVHLQPVNAEITQQMIEMVPEAANKITVIPHHVDTNTFRPLQREKRFDLVYVGRLTTVKNVEALLTAVERAGVTIAMIGGGTVSTDGSDLQGKYESQLKKRFGDLDGRIHWLGRIKNHELPLYINQAKAFILCSLSEGQPRALIEAMACGVPCIGTNVFGIKHTLQHGVTGFLCDTDADSIAAAIKTVTSQPELMRKMGENARRFAVENYSLPQLAQKEYELLVDLARRHPVGSMPKRVAQYVLRRR